MFTNSRTLQILQRCGTSSIDDEHCGEQTLSNSDMNSNLQNHDLSAAETVNNKQLECQVVETSTRTNFDQNDIDLSATFSEIPLNDDMDVDLENIEIFTEDGIKLSKNQPTGMPAEDEKNNNCNNTNSILGLLNNNVCDDENDRDYTQEDDSTEEEMEQEYKKWSIKNRNKRKENRNVGKEYLTVKGHVRKSRKMRPIKSCRKQCSQRISDEQRSQIFKMYWDLASYEKRKIFLISCVTVLKKKVARLKEDGKKHKNRENTYIYQFEIKGENVAVCKECFLATLDESPKFVYNSVLNKLNSPLGVPNDDLRGRHVKTSLGEESLQNVRQHIASFPAYESHYTRRHTKRLYLASHLNLSIMYKLYCETVDKPVSLSSYRSEFQKTGLKFKRPALDTCPTCDSLSMTVRSTDEDIKNEAEQKLRYHQEDADEAYERKKEDKVTSLGSQDMRVLVFDLQQVLPTPLLTSGDVFYKRQFSVYNLTVHDCTTEKAVHYMWDESIAKRGSIEIASCIYNVLLKMPPEVKSVILYSDTCGGQNKNSNVIAMFMYILRLHPTLTTIDHKFLIAGHTHMECDSDHAVIERKSKRSPFPIYHPRDWQQLVRIASKKDKFDVKAMSQADFFDFSDVFKKFLQKRKVDEHHDQFNFRHIRWLRFSKTEDFGIFYYKTCLDKNSPFKKMTFQRKKKVDVPLGYQLPCPYKGVLPISELKKDNLLSLLDKVDSHAADFYRSLPTTNNLVDFDPDLDRLDADEQQEEN